MKRGTARRRYPRFRLRRPAFLRVADDGRELFGRTEALAVGGCSLQSHEPFRTGDTYELEICLAGARIRAVCRIVHQRRADCGGYEAGAEFLRVGDPDSELLRALLPGGGEALPLAARQGDGGGETPEADSE